MASTSATLPRHQASTRSEQLLQNLLVKDGVARSRSLSRGSATAGAVPIDLYGPAPPLPVDAAVTRPSRSHFRNDSSSAGSHDSSSDERPMFASNGIGAAHGVITRPHLPSPRKTHDGVLSPAPRRSSSPSPPHPHRHHTVPLIHANSSPHFGDTRHSPIDWSYDESSGPGSPSFMSSGYSSASHLPGTPASAFNLQSATEYCRQQQGYVSFGEIEGLGWPAGEEEEERLERQRLEIEMRRKRGWWNWIEEGILARPKTPANVQE